MAKNEWSLAQLKSKAEIYCAAAEHYISDVRTKLSQWGATPEQYEEIIAHLLACKYIDEERFCRAYAHDKLVYQGWGRIKIGAYLHAKQLPSDAIHQALEELDDIEYQKTLQHVIASKKRNLKSTDPMAREKLLRFCTQRGFTYEEISEYL